jgi:hypothetical protein
MSVSELRIVKFNYRKKNKKQVISEAECECNGKKVTVTSGQWTKEACKFYKI